MVQGWDLVAENRRAFADLVEPLEPAQAATPSLCGSWTVHQVAGHLTSFVDVAFPVFMANIARCRFDYDKAADRMARRLARRPLDQLAATLRSKAAKKPALPMFPPEMTVADVAIHTQDIRRPLGLAGTLSTDTLRTTLVFLATHKMGKNIADPAAYDGLRLVATDLDWIHGDGQEVSAPAEALMMAMAGRSVFDELNGTGAAMLQARRS